MGPRQLMQSLADVFTMSLPVGTLLDISCKLSFDTLTSGNELASVLIVHCPISVVLRTKPTLFIRDPIS